MNESTSGGYAVEMWLSEDYAGGLQGQVEHELSAALESARARGRAEVTVAVHEGVAMLVGRVSAWAEKVAAREAVMRVPRVTALDDCGLVVRPAAAEARRDAELAAAARSALDWDSGVPRGVRVAATAGRLTVSGVVDHEDERAAAVAAVSRLIGVCEVVNEIVVPPRERPAHALSRIEEAWARVLGREAKHVRLVVNESGVAIMGRVSSLALRREAERAVRRVLGDVSLSAHFH